MQTEFDTPLTRRERISGILRAPMKPIGKGGRKGGEAGRVGHPMAANSGAKRVTCRLNRRDLPAVQQSNILRKPFQQIPM
jgi:hypothetical protein